MDPTTYAEMRPGAYDIDERVRDMNRNGIESRAWKAASANLNNILALSGDYPIAGHTGAAAPVFDIDSVGLLEMEGQPGYHSTGRSAAIFSEAYGNELVRAITRASRAFFYSPPADFASIDLVKPRQVLIIAHHGQEQALKDFLTSARSAGGMELS